MVKKRNNNNYLQRKIKVVLVDHHQTAGIPYERQIEGEGAEEEDEL